MSVVPNPQGYLFVPPPPGPSLFGGGGLPSMLATRFLFTPSLDAWYKFPVAQQSRPRVIHRFLANGAAPCYVELFVVTAQVLGPPFTFDYCETGALVNRTREWSANGEPLIIPADSILYVHQTAVTFGLLPNTSGTTFRAWYEDYDS